MDENRDQGARKGSDGAGRLRPGSAVARERRDALPSVSAEPGWELAAALAERLLDGEEVPGADPRTARLAELLAAARDLPPGRPQDEAAALDAFRRARTVRSGHRTRVSEPGGPGRRAARGPRPARILAGSAVAVLTMGGVAIAAQGGLPHPFPSPHHVTHGPSAPASETPGDTDTTTPPRAPRAPGESTRPDLPGSTPGAATPPPGAQSAAPGAPDHAGSGELCETYSAAERVGTDPDRAVQDRLAQEAGGVARIDAYCATVTVTHGADHGRSSPQPHPDPHPGVTSPPASAASPSARPSPSVSAPVSLAPHGSPAPTTPGHPRRQ